MKSRDINTFPVGAKVSVPNLPDYQGVTITRISDSGVTVNGPQCGRDVVISGRAPAIPFEEVASVAQVESVKPESISVESTPSGRAPRGTYTDKMNSIKVPDGDFTVRQLAELNEIPLNYANTWVKTNCVEVGHVERIEGQRGKAAGLFRKK